MTRNRWLPVVAGFIVGVVVALMLLLPHGQVAGADPKPAPQPLVGRYQYLRGVPGVGECLLDTATGKVWKFDTSPASKWIPALDAPK